MHVLFTLLIMSFAVTVLLAIRMAVALRRYRTTKRYTGAVDAPSVTVCIPARNETHAMAQCLERVLASDYKKMEVIVFDDSSADDTSVLIKSFAHAGVRFVPGTQLPDGWLGRNHALDVLANEASGMYLVFMDVDTTIRPTTISQLVSYAVTEKATMVSAIPARDDTDHLSALMGSLRYLWELVLARSTAPAASSAFWMIDRHMLVDTMGGFAPHKSEVLVEQHIAAIVDRGYRCIMGRHIGAAFEKKWRSQAETSRRLLYPTMGGRWYGAVVGAAVLALLAAPTAVLVSGVGVWNYLHWAALAIVVVQVVVYMIYLQTAWTSRWWLGGWLWPYVIVQELCLFVASVWGYMRGTITWKGRSITASPVRVDYLEIDN